MTNHLQQYFPMIRTKEEILAEITGNRKLAGRFYSWSPQQREEFLNFCAGVKGVKVLYDSFSKEILNPEYAPERLEDLLTLLLKKQVRILCTLPDDSTRITDENTLVVTDIVVELEDGGIANIEVQKIGYKFPGERSACYSADMLLRQYRRVRDARKKSFSYEDIKNVYTVVLFEKSPASFHLFQDTYVHYFEQRSDSGLELELLQKYIFIPLDIFKKNRYNRAITNRLDAWFAFFCEDDPEKIVDLIRAYPEFKFMYEDIYRMCRNMEGVMGIFSEELRILDRNTAQLMIDEMQDELAALGKEKRILCTERDTLSAECDTLSAERDTLSVELEKIKKLNRLLAEQGRADDIIKAATDEIYCKQLYEEFAI